MKINFVASSIFDDDTTLDAVAGTSTLPAGTAQWAFSAEDTSKQSPSLIFICPCGCKKVRIVPVKTGLKIANNWHWDGNLETPSLTPSILVIDECKWHGFLTNGEWRNA